MRVLNIENGVPITGLAYSPDSTMLSACGVWEIGGEEHPTVWQQDALSGGSPYRDFLPVHAFTPRLSYSPDCQKLAVWTDPPIVLDLTRSDRVTGAQTFRWGDSEDSGFCFGGDGRTVHGLKKRQLVSADTQTGAKQEPLAFPIPRVSGFSSTRIGLRRAANANRFALSVLYTYPAGWMARRCAILVREEQSPRSFPIIKWNTKLKTGPDNFELSAAGDRVAVLVGRTVCVWDVNSALELASLAESRKVPESFAFSADGRYLGVLFQDSVSLYDTASWTVAKTYSWKVGKLRSLAFSPDGATAAVGSDTGKVVVFDLE